VKTSSTRRWLGWLGCGTAVCLVVACAPETRYRVLSFVFDGVPPPSGPDVVEITPVAKPPGYTKTFNGGLSLAAQGKTPLEVRTVVLSVHKPVAENQCGECHDPSMGFDTMPAHDARLCDKCHQKQREEEGWSHGPINLGTCIPCHVPHKSTHLHLLSKSIPELCLQCHEEDLERPEEYHDVPNVNQCVACHDPHRMY